MFKGLLIKESLADKSILDHLTVTKKDTWDVANSVEGQSPVWNIDYFEIKPETIDNIAKKLSDSLRTGKWYINCTDGIQEYVIFKEKIFNYKKDHIDSKNEAKKYARTLGIPESQLDW